MKKTMIGTVCCLSGLVISAATNRVEELTLTADRTVNVAAGDVCEVDGLYSDGVFTLTKTGPGELLVHDVAGAARARVDVQAGAFNVISAEPLCCTNAYIHLDAARLATIATNGTGVTSWGDAHANGRSATGMRADGYANPLLVSNGLNGLPVVDFRSLRNNMNGGTLAGPAGCVKFTRTTAVRDVLMVVADADEIKSLYDQGQKNVEGPAFLGDSSTYPFHRGYLVSGHGPTIVRSNASANVRGGDVFVDGVKVCATSTYPDGFHVLGFRLTNSVLACYIGLERWCAAGGLKYGEAIVFTGTPISTNAYARAQNWLLWKWFGRSSAELAKVSVGAGATATIAPNVTVGEYAGAGGDVTVAAGGALTLASALDGAASRGAYIRLDASAAETLTTNAAGRVTAWSDANGNGRRAQYNGNPAAPVADTPAGLTALDCGPYYNGTIKPSGAGLYLFDRTTNVLDAVVVVSDREEIPYLKTNYTEYATLPELNPSNANGPFFIGDSAKFQFHRGKLSANAYPRLMFSSGASTLRSTGRVYLDNALVAPESTRMKAGYHVVGYRSSGNLCADRLADDRSLARGGCKIAEVFIFTNTLADADFGAISKALQAKWLGSGEGVVQAVRNLSVGTGATLTAPDAGFEVSGTLTLDGTLRTYRVRANGLAVGADGFVDGTLVVSNSIVTLRMDASGNVTPISASAVAIYGPGELAFGGDHSLLIGKGAVKLIATSDLRSSLHPEAKWTCADRTVRVSLEARADGVYGTFAGRGLMLIVR